MANNLASSLQPCPSALEPEGPHTDRVSKRAIIPLTRMPFSISEWSKDSWAGHLEGHVFLA